ncbi:hypothetical protein [Phenylobacterium sp.]|uniref:hypothetical protein n=1 Tax=Phenylobacterium sp. TaxID=1871053 RepID=UPI0025FE64BC|nr:hypothetical protein [Phenylobacterium sp.]
MKIVSSNTDAELAANRALEQVEGGLVELTANLIRVVRGAGRPGDIIEQVVGLTEALREYGDAAGHLPAGDELAGMIRLESREVVVGHVSESSAAWHYAEQRMVRGALQMAASSLLGQLTQRAAGSQELFNGLFEIERMREENRRETSRAARAGRARTPKRSLKKSAAKPRKS